MFRALYGGYDSHVKRAAFAILVLGIAGGCRVDPVVKSTSDGRIEQAMVSLPGGVEVDLVRRRLSIPGTIAIDHGWLEVVACTEGTREHEAIFVTAVKPSVVHTGLLLVDAEPGDPATYNRTTKRSIPPHGGRLQIALEWNGDDGTIVSLQLGEVLETSREIVVPEFVFAGSVIAPNTPSMGPGEHYVADFTGNIVGLATFGDEVIASVQVHSPETSQEPAAWRVREGALPPSGTPARLLLRVVE